MTSRGGSGKGHQLSPFPFVQSVTRLEFPGTAQLLSQDADPREFIFCPNKTNQAGFSPAHQPQFFVMLTKPSLVMKEKKRY